MLGGRELCIYGDSSTYVYRVREASHLGVNIFCGNLDKHRPGGIDSKRAAGLPMLPSLSKDGRQNKPTFVTSGTFPRCYTQNRWFFLTMWVWAKVLLIYSIFGHSIGEAEGD